MSATKGKREIPRKRQARPAGRGGGQFLAWIMVFLLGALLLSIIPTSNATGRSTPLTLAQIDEALESGNVERVDLRDDGIAVSLKGQKEVHRRDLPPDLIGEYTQRCARLKAEGKIVSYDYTRPSAVVGFLVQTLVWLVLPLMFLTYFFLVRPMRSSGGPGGILNFGKSRAMLLSKDKTHTTFDDVAGIDEAKEEVREIIEFLRTPAKFQELGGRIPRGVLLVGPPGTGKTLLAKAIAGEAGVPFFSISGSDFVEMFVGVGASRVRDLFRQAKEKSPCIIFLDEIDAVGRRRGSGVGGGDHEREQTLNAILVEIDGFSSDSEVIVIAATNRPELLDPALLRPGRFDREITIDLPDLRGRKQILEVHARKVRMDADADLSVLARSTPGFTGADLEAVINEAALLAAFKGKKAVDYGDLEEARDKVKWGRKKSSRMQVMTEEDKRVTAYHESGHALVTKMESDSEPIHKVSIIPMGRALGATMFLPVKDRYHMNRRQILSLITVSFGGRVAEEVFCEDISTGAEDDYKKATELARRMVTEWGMSEAVGPIYLSDREASSFLGHDMPRVKDFSEETSRLVDKEVRRILDECYAKAKEHIQAHVPEVERMVAALMKYEVLDAQDVDRILAGEALDAGKKERELQGRAPATPAPASVRGPDAG